MASVSWTNTTGGNFNTGANWSTGHAPGAADDATVNTSSVITIAYNSGADTLGSLYFGGNDTLALSTGSLTVLGNTSFYGTLTQTGGKLSLGGAASLINGNISQSVGTLSVTSGTLTLNGSNSFTGSLLGTSVDFANGSDFLNGAVSVQQLEMTGAAVTLSGGLTTAGSWLQTAGTLRLGGNIFAVKGGTTLDGGIVTGAGTFAVSGQTEIGNGFEMQEQSVLSNTGTIAQTGYFYLGYNGTDTSKLVNAAGAVFRMDGDTTMNASADATLTNMGTLIKAGGGTSSVIYANVVSTGTVSASRGTLIFDNGTDSFAGALAGAGTIDFGSGTDALQSGLSITGSHVLLSGATVTLAASLADASDFSQTSGSLALGGHTLTLSAASLDGGQASGSGTILATGSAEVDGYYLTGSTVLDNTGTLIQDGQLTVGYNSADTAQFINASGATWQIDGSSIVYGQADAGITNAGTLDKGLGSGTSRIGVSLASTGTVTVTAGALDFTGAAESFSGSIGGTGALLLNGTASKFANGLALTVAQTDLQSGVLTLGGNLSYAGIWSQTGGTLALGGHALTLTGTAALENTQTSGSGTLSVKSGELSGFAAAGSTILKDAGTLTQTGNLYIGYYNGDTAKLAIAAKTSLLIEGSNTIYGTSGSVITNAGLIAKANGAGNSGINVSTASTGTISIQSGSLFLSGASNSLAGTVSGAGTLALNTGADSLASGIKLSVGNVLFDGATVTLGGALTYAGAFTQTGGVLALGGNALMLAGTATFDGGVVSGAGTVAIAGGEVSTEQFEGSVVVQNSGAINVVNYAYIGYNSSDTVELQNLAGATLRLEGDSTLYGDAGASIANAGTIVKLASGSASLNDSTTTTGTLTVAAGLLALQGANNSLGGVVNGAGTLVLNTGADSFSSGVSLTVGGLLLSGATVTVGSKLSYAGSFVESNGTLSLTGSGLALSGPVSLTGGFVTGSGTLTASGQTSVTGGALEGSVALNNTGTITASDYFYIGYNSGDTAQLDNAAGGLLRIEAGASIYGTSGSDISNAGSIVKTGSATTQINVATLNSGKIELAQGGMSFVGNVSGAGTITADAGTRLAFTGAVSGGQVVLGADTDLSFSTSAGFSDTIHGFAAGDVIELANFGYGSTNGLTYNAGNDTLAVTNGSGSVTLQLAGSYTAGSFQLFNDNGIIGITHT